LGGRLIGAGAHQPSTPFPEPVGGVEHRLIPGPAGEILARIYSPEGDGPFPVLVYFHGGGWVIATLSTYDASCRALCNLAECIVVSVAYRQAPEHKFPAAVEDAFAAYQWVRQSAAKFNGDPGRVAVGGESAGGNLATVVALLARDAGIQPPSHQLLVYPVTDFSFDTPSYRQNGEAKPLNAAMMRWFWRHYLPSEAEGRDPRASPLQAPDLSRLPPATVITAEIDPLHSEREAYAARLAEAGVPVEHRHFVGVTHEFFGMVAGVSEAKEAVEFAAANLKRAFAVEPSHSTR
jgi:acetyl esterase